MQGFVFKAAIIAIAVVTMLLSSSSTFAKYPTHSKANTMFNSEAGCMRCHQGETIMMTSNEIEDEKSSNTRDKKQRRSSQK